MGNTKLEKGHGAKYLFETIVYTALSIITFGAAWLLKIIIKRAIVEANDC